ncbi:MAG: cupin domain-containing protein [Atopobiaceae bacterium]|nr:cupin domain-containing protein [Atopobiaceae bacterium]
MAWKERAGQTFSIARDNAPVPGCTVSREVYGGDNSVAYFSLARQTDISAELFPYHKLLLVNDGTLEVYGADSQLTIRVGDSVLTPTGVPVGMRSEDDAVYTEISIRKDDIVNEAIKAGEVFRLAELVPYAEGRIVNMDVAHNDRMKFVVMAFDEGTGLSEHAAPGEALVFALDGEAVIGYEGAEHPISAGECFHFAKGGLHSVKATGRFKMALLLTLE